MSTKAVGAYILLLCKAWRENPPASIPSSEPVLARWARVSAEEWAELRSEVLSAWTLEAGRYHNRRLRMEYDKFVRFKKDKQQAGKHGAEIRWKDKPKIAEPKQSHSNAIAEPWQSFAVASAVSNAEKDKDLKILRAATPPPARPEVRIKRATDTPWQRAVDHIHANFLARKGLPPEWSGLVLKRLQSKVARFGAAGVMALWDEACRRLWHVERAHERDLWNAQRWRQDGHRVLFFIDELTEYLSDDNAWKSMRDKYAEAVPSDIARLAKGVLNTGKEPGARQCENCRSWNATLTTNGAFLSCSKCRWTRAARPADKTTKENNDEQPTGSTGATPQPAAPSGEGGNPGRGDGGDGEPVPHAAAGSRELGDRSE